MDIGRRPQWWMSQGPSPLRRNWSAFRRRLLRVVVVFAASALLLGCSGGVVLEPTEGPVLEPRNIAEAMVPQDPVTPLGAANEAELALRSSELFFKSAQVVVLASAAEPEARDRAGSLAVTLGTPVLLTSEPGEDLTGHGGAASAETGSLNAELLRLGTRAVLTVGEVSLHQLDTTSLVVTPVPNAPDELSSLIGQEVTEVPAPEHGQIVAELAVLDPGEVFEAAGLDAAETAYGTFPTTLASDRIERVTVLAEPDPVNTAAVATAHAAGAEVLVGTSPASRSEVVDHMAVHPSRPVVGIGEGFVDREGFEYLVRSMQAGKLLPSGAQRVFQAEGSEVRVLTVAARRAMQDPGVTTAEDVLARARKYAAQYADAPGLGSASGVEVDAHRTSPNDLAYWADRAHEADQYLILRIRPEGELLNAVTRYEDLLARPEVGIRIDLSAGAGVDAGEVNDVLVYLRHLIREEKLPQKLLIVDLGGADSGGAGELRHPNSLTPASGEVALTLSIARDAEELGDGNRGQFGESVYWGSTLTKTLGDGEVRGDGETDDPPRQYPPPEELPWSTDVNLMTFR